MAIKTESIKKNYFYNVLYQAIALLVPIATTPYISRVLGPDGIGVYSYTYSIAQICILVSNLGISLYGQIEIAKRRDDIFETSKLFYELFIIKLASTVICCLIYIIMSLKISDYPAEQMIFLVMVFANVMDFTWFFQGIERFKNVAIRNTVLRLSVLFLLFAYVKTEADIGRYCFLVAISVLLGNISFLPAMKGKLIPVGIRKLNPLSHIKNCWVYFFPTIAISIYTVVDKIMIGALTVGSEENGYYEQAHKVEQILFVVISSLNIIMRSRMTYLIDHDQRDEFNKRLKESLHFVLMLAFPMTFGLIGVSYTFIPIFLGEGFERSIILLQVFSILFILIGLSNYTNTHVLTPLRRQKYVNIVLGIGAFVNFVGNLIFIPICGALGAAMFSVVSEAIVLFGYLHFAKDFIKIGTILETGKTYLMASVIMFIPVCYINGLNLTIYEKLIAQIAIGSLLYILSVTVIFRDYYAVGIIRLLLGKNKNDYEKL